jgi:hypothetical protein
MPGAPSSRLSTPGTDYTCQPSASTYPLRLTQRGQGRDDAVGDAKLAKPPAIRNGQFVRPDRRLNSWIAGSVLIP